MVGALLMQHGITSQGDIVHYKSPAFIFKHSFLPTLKLLMKVWILVLFFVINYIDLFIINLFTLVCFSIVELLLKFKKIKSKTRVGLMYSPFLAKFPDENSFHCSTDKLHFVNWIH